MWEILIITGVLLMFMLVLIYSVQPRYPAFDPTQFKLFRLMFCYITVFAAGMLLGWYLTSIGIVS